MQVLLVIRNAWDHNQIRNQGSIGHVIYWLLLFNALHCSEQEHLTFTDFHLGFIFQTESALKSAHAISYVPYQNRYLL